MPISEQRRLLPIVSHAMSHSKSNARRAHELAKYFEGEKISRQIVVGQDFSLALRYRRHSYMMLVGPRQLKVLIFSAAPERAASDSDDDSRCNDGPWKCPLTKICKSDMSLEKRGKLLEILRLKPQSTGDQATNLATHLKVHLTRQFRSENSSWQVIVGLPKKFDVIGVYESGSFADIRVGSLRCVAFQARCAHVPSIDWPKLFRNSVFAIQYLIPAISFLVYMWLRRTCETSCIDDPQDLLTCTSSERLVQENCAANMQFAAQVAVAAVVLTTLSRFVGRFLPSLKKKRRTQ